MIKTYSSVCPDGHELRNFTPKADDNETFAPCVHGVYPKGYLHIRAGMGYPVVYPWGKAMRRPVTGWIGEGTQTCAFFRVRKFNSSCKMKKLQLCMSASLLIAACNGQQHTLANQYGDEDARATAAIYNYENDDLINEQAEHTMPDSIINIIE